MSESDMKLVESCVLIGLEASEAGDVIHALGATLVDAGYILPEYVADVIEREGEFSTGLPTAVPIAIPHASSGNCVTTALAVGILKQPVGFGEMGTPGNRLDVEMVFLLAIKNVHEQTIWLRNLMKIFKNKELMLRLKSCDEPSQVVLLMSDALKG